MRQNPIRSDSAHTILADFSKTDTNQVIAILDTCVDWNHPDLKNRIKINLQEKNGSSNMDDDNNGKTDDLRGWDFINNDNNPTDDNSHGTHVAGIAAAQSNNNIGIAGVSGAKILPIKILQSSGYGDATTISLGITYSANNGATVLNMSFGSYSRSQTMENALAYVYYYAVLVASAGNDGLCIGPGLCPDNKKGRPIYPAALSYVLGIQATSQNNIKGYGYRATFSNYDQDGPIYSGYSDALNYEIYSPGQSIISTIPESKYSFKSGTSMSAPAIAGAAAIYRSLFPNRSKERIFIDFINTNNSTTKNLDLVEAINNPAQPPNLQILNYTIIDTIGNADQDGNADAGETIELLVNIRNVGGATDSVYVALTWQPFEDTSVTYYIHFSVTCFPKALNNSSWFTLSKNSLISRSIAQLYLRTCSCTFFTAESALLLGR